MKNTLLIAAIMLVLISLTGCDMIEKIIPLKNATVGDKANSDNPTREGADITLISSSATALTVKIENNTDSTWQSGNMRDYHLEARKDGEWYTVNQIGEFANTMELMIFAPGENMTHTFEFSERYGKLADGKYRVVKSFWANATPTTEAHEFHLICEFTVE